MDTLAEKQKDDQAMLISRHKELQSWFSVVNIFIFEYRECICENRNDKVYNKIYQNFEIKIDQRCFSGLRYHLLF